jgi:nucleoid-associated protein YgaU
VSSGSVQETPVQETASQDAAGEMTQDGSHAEETAAAALGEVHTETPTSAVSPADAQPVKSYVVKKGDTLMGICKYEYGDAQKYRQLMEANGLTDPDRIYEGQQLVIP